MNSENSNIIGFALFGLATRLGQLAIMKRPLYSNPTAHVLSMAAFGYGGYWVHKWEIRAAEIIAEKKAEIAERRKLQIAQAENRGAAQLSSEISF